jgi:hypothetical protein
LVKPQFFLFGLYRRIIAALPKRQSCWVNWRYVNDTRDDEHHKPHHGHPVQQPSDDEIEHIFLVIGYWLLVIGYWLLVIGYWLLVIGYWLLGYWLLGY